ncbi:MAG: dienelactone hydrolase family protein [Candidatus Eremiobacteraeota bacterium]|nr:dienelactone hydrolase family protein [Candidatus Eremiobacteraeota bacterium]MCW5867767.1 dienelactone hydrolase family protein [Candidatus Eremiobacteraeota bacterium]
MRKILLLLILLCTHGLAQEWARARLEKSPRHLEWVKVKAGARTVECFVAYPEVKGKAPSIVLIHEIFGLTDWVRLVADELAAHGYVVIAPDLLSEMGPKGGGTAEFGGDDAARKGVGTLQPEQVTADLHAAAGYVKTLPAASSEQSVAGFCWGGAQSFRFATTEPGLQRALVFYGSPPEHPEKAACPIYGFYAENDARINQTLETTKKTMQAAGKTFEPRIYTGAGHGFMRAGAAPDASEANAQACKDGWKRMLDLLKGK